MPHWNLPQNQPHWNLPQNQSAKLIPQCPCKRVTDLGHGLLSQRERMPGGLHHHGIRCLPNSCNCFPRTLTWNPTPPSSRVAGTSYTLRADRSPNAGNGVVYSVTSGPCRMLTSTIISFDAAGTCSYRAISLESFDWGYASVFGTTTVTPATQSQTITVSWSDPGARYLDGRTYSPSASAPGGTVTRSASPSNVCRMQSSTTIEWISTGTCTVTFSRPASPGYFAAPNQIRSFSVAKASQSISFSSFATATFGDGNRAVPVSATSGLGIAMTASGACSLVSGTTIRFLSGGSCNIVANQAGDGLYNAASQQTITYIIQRRGQTITVPADPSGARYNGPSVSYSPSSSSGLAVSVTASGACSRSGSTLSWTGAGTCTLTSTQGGDSRYLAAGTVTRLFNVARAPQTISFSSSPPNPPRIGGSYTATATGTLAMTISHSGSACSRSGSTLTFTQTGACNVIASNIGNSFYLPASLTDSLTVLKGAQTVTFSSSAVAAVVDGTYTVTGSASSDLAVRFTVAGSCTISGQTSGSVVTFTAAGSNACTVYLDQAGNLEYEAAPQKLESITVGKGSQVVSFSTTPGARQVDGADYTVSASSNKGLSISYTAFPVGVCVMRSSNRVGFVGSGTCSIRATAASNGNYNSASRDQSQEISKGDQTVAFTSSGFEATLDGPTYTPTVTSSSGLTPVVSSTTETICTVSGGVVSFPGQGNCILALNQVGNGDYNPAPQVTQTIGVGFTPQTITVSSTAPSNPKLGVAQPYTMAATTDANGLLVSFSTTTPTICTSSGTRGSVFTFIGAGTCQARADQAGDATRNAATTRQQTITVTRGDQTLTISTPSQTYVVGGPSYTPTATSSISALTPTISLSVSTPDKCTMDGAGAITFIETGSCTIQASAPQSTNYLAATAAPRSFTIGRGPQTVSITSAAPGGAQVSGSTTDAVIASASSNLSPTLSSMTTTVCQLTGPASGATLSYLTAGQCTLQVTQSGNSDYLAAPATTQSFTVFKGTQVISFGSTPSSPVVAGPTYTVTATASPSSLAPQFAVDPAAASICSVAGSSVTFQQRGECIIVATQAGNGNYNAALPQTQQFQVQGGSQTVSFSSTFTTAVVDGPTYTPASQSSVAGLVTTHSIATASPVKCTIANGVVSFVGAGTCRILANQGGDANYNEAPQQSQDVTVGKGAQSVTFGSAVPTAAVVSGTPYSAVATSSSGQAVTFSVPAAASSICSVSGTSVTFQLAGNCIVEADSASNVNYLVAQTVRQTFSVAKADQEVSFTTTPNTVFVAGATYTPAAQTSAPGITATLAIDSVAAAICSMNGAGDVSFQKSGLCIVNANAAGNGAYNAAAQVQQTFQVEKAPQTIMFTSTAPTSVQFFLGSLYEPLATSDRGLNVSFVVNPDSLGICDLSPDGKLVLALSVGDCTLAAVQAGTDDVGAATPVIQSFNVSISTDSTVYPTEDLTSCGTRTQCAIVSSAILGPEYAKESTGSLQVQGIVETFSTCNASEWLNQCNVDRIAQLNPANAARVANLDVLLKNVTILLAQCNTTECRQVLSLIKDSYTELVMAAATSCLSPLCTQYSEARSVISAEQIAAGGPLEPERIRFDDSIENEVRRKLQRETAEYAACTDQACRDRISVNKINRTFAVLGYVRNSIRFGFQVADTRRGELRGSVRASISQPYVDELAANFTRCTVGASCSKQEINDIYRQKRAGIRYFILWGARLDELAAMCQTETCRVQIGAEQTQNDRNVYLMSDYLDESLCIPGFLFYSLLIVAAVVIGVFGLLWKTFFGKELFWAVLAGVVLTSIFRLAMFALGLLGVGTSSIDFVITDKLGSLFFALTILVFVYMWARAIAILMDAPQLLQYILIGLSLAVALAITVVTIVFAVSISRDFVATFYSQYVLDYAEVILAAFTFALVLTLFIFVLVVGFKLGALRGGVSDQLEAKADEKLRNLKLIAIAVGAMVLFLAMRLVLVALRAAPITFSLGYLTFYVVATLIPETLSCIVMLGIVLFTFYQSKHVAVGSNLKSNSTYQSSASAASGIELTSRYDV